MRHEFFANRRNFLKTSALAGTALAGASGAIAQLASSSRPAKSDIAILRFLSALEQIEADLWLQYAELGGVRPESELKVPPKGNGPYTAALANLDTDMPQYINDNTDDEFTHHAFLNAYLESVGAKEVDLGKFATLNGSKADGSSGKKRLTNLMELTVDTSWWGRYRSSTKNPDLDPSFKFPQAVPDLVTNGPFTAIPRDNNDTKSKTQIQAIANTAAFHFGFIEQGGTSLYPTLALRANDPVVLRILLSIGPSETMHFQVWHDKAGNAVAPPFNVTFGKLSFPDLSPTAKPGEDLQTNLIMPEPCPFLDRKFPAVSIIRPVSTDPKIFGAVQAVKGFTDDGLFIGQSQAFFALINELAQEADQATRHCG
ncbi:MAG: ferritin-like domain-containing protein [Methylocapsa sp.]|nr:ferritin-like domain-containing protein [Methylocapsa sp.]